VLQLPRSEEEIELLSGLVGIARLDMHDETGVGRNALRHAAVAEKRRHELVQE